MKRKILNSSLALLMIGTQFSPVILSAAANGSARWGVHSGNTQMSNTYPYPTEDWEDLMKNAYGQISENDKYNRVSNLDSSLIDVAKSNLTSTLTEGIVINSSQTQAEVTSNLTWSGSAWSSTDVSGEANAANRRSLLTSGVSNQSFKIKEYATYFNTNTGVTQLLDMKVNVAYNDTTRTSTDGGVDVAVSPSGISWNKGGTDELIVEITYYKTGTSTVVNAPVMYHLTDFDNGGTFGVNNNQVYGVWSYLPTTSGAWSDVYDTYQADGNVFNYKVFWDQLSTANQTNTSCSRYYTRNDRTIYKNIGNFGSAPSGNLTPTERGSGRLKFVNKGNYTAIVDGWSTNTNSNSSSNGCAMTTNGKDGEVVLVMDSSATITMSQMAAVSNYGVNNGSGDTLMMRPYDYQAIISAENDASGVEGVVKTDSQLLSLMNVNYNNPTGRTITVDQSAIDYNTPGTYKVNFTIDSDESGSMTTSANYTVTNVVPVITGNDTVTVELNSNEIIDFTTAFGLSSTDAAENTTSKLTYEFVSDEPLVVDEKYAKTGTYNILVTSEDDTGYESATKILTLNIVRDIYDGNVIDNTYDIDDPEVSSDEKHSDNEHVYYTDEELSEMYNVTGNFDDMGFRTLSIDSSNIDFNTPGLYDLIFSVKDNISGNVDSISVTYEVLDILPTITADEEATVMLNEYEQDYKSLFNVNATEIADGDLTVSVTVAPDEDILLNDGDTKSYIKTGDFDITFTVSDDEGNETSTTSVLHVIRDIEAEIDLIESEVGVVPLELSADESYSDNEHVSYTDEELIEMYNVAGNWDYLGFRTLSVDSSAIDFNTPGTYDIVFTITENISGDTLDVTSTYEVLDILPTIAADDEVTVLLNDNEIDYSKILNAIATEIENGDLTDSIVVTTDDEILLDENNKYIKTGDFDITFTVSDDEGNEVSTNSILHVKRNIDQEVDVIDNNKNVVPLELEADSEASDNEETTHTDEELIEMFNVIGNWDYLGFRILDVDQSEIDYNTPGEYPVTFTITDSISKETKVITSTYKVLDVVPTITAEDIIEVNLNDNVLDYINDFNVIASEFSENDINDSINYKFINAEPLVSDNTYIMTGTYKIEFTASDNDGNEVSTISTLKIKRNITDITTVDNNVNNVKIKFTVNNNYANYENVEYTDKELIKLFNAQGNYDGSYIKLDVNHNIDFETPGDYPVTFTLTETISGETLEVTSTYTVIDILPTITGTPVIYTEVVKSQEEVPNKLAEILKKANIVATEFKSGDLNDSLSYKGNINVSSPGLYEIFITATDSDNNEVTFPLLVSLTDFEGVGYEGDYLTVEDFLDYWNLTLESPYITLHENIDYDTPGIYPVTIDYKLPYSFILEQEYDNLSDEMKDLIDNYENTDEDKIEITTPIKSFASNLLTNEDTKEEEQYVEGTMNGTYEVVDILPTITSNNKVTVNLGDEIDLIELFNPIASEFEDGDLTEEITIDDSNVIYNQRGTYQIIFNVKDDEGNEVSSISTLTIIGDTPTITGDTMYTDLENIIYTKDELIDIYNIEANGDIEIAHTIDFETPGTYPATFVTTNEDTGESASIEATYTVQDVLPEIEAKDNVEIYVSTPEIDNSLTEDELIDAYKVTAKEFEKGDINDSIEIDSSDIAYDEVGEYNVIFKAVDSDGNEVSHTSKLIIKSPLTILETGQTLAIGMILFITVGLTIIIMFEIKENKKKKAD